MDGMSFSEQAEWWSGKDVVVAAHGASMSNLIFMRDNASVVELYPEHYYPLGMYKTLSKSTGVSQDSGRPNSLSARRLAASPSRRAHTSQKGIGEPRFEAQKKRKEQGDEKDCLVMPRV
jgi:hypothetical protein